MTDQLPLKELLRWRLAQAEAEAPPAPSAAKLLNLVQPWWENWPERFQSLVLRLTQIEVAYGHAMVELPPAGNGHRVPALIFRASQETETTVRVSYVSVRKGQLHLRFELSADLGPAESNYEVTFISNGTAQPLFLADAGATSAGEYRLDAEIPSELEAVWERLKVTDRMPFRLILRPVARVG